MSYPDIGRHIYKLLNQEKTLLQNVTAFTL